MTRTTRQTAEPLENLGLVATGRNVHDLIGFIRNGHTDLNPPYQRPSVWTEDQRIGLIYSWLRGLPIPAIAVNRRDPAWGWSDGDRYPDAVIDGKQRLETALAWFNGKLAVPASWFDPEYVAKTVQTDDGPYVRFTGLTPTGQRFSKREFIIPVAESKLPSITAVAEVYLIVNGGGTPQTESDMARAERVSKGGKR
jgi:hypothetical protein